MNKTHRALIATIILTTVAATAYASNIDGFHTTWDAARQAAKAEGKPIYLHFTTTWCSWCRKIESETYTSAVAVAALKNFVPASLDCTDTDTPDGRANVQLMQRFGGKGYPFLVMVTAEGIVLETISGYVPPEPFAATLTKAKARYDKWAAFQAWAAKVDRTSYEYYARSLAINTTLDRSSEAAAAARKMRELDPQDKHGGAAVAAVALLTEAISKPASPEQTKTIAALKAEIRRRDPKNAKGALQEVLFLETLDHLRRVAATTDPTARAALLDQTAQRVEAVQRVAKAPEKIQLLWAYVGQFNAQAGRKAESLTALSKAIKAAPNGELVPQINKIIAQLSAAGS